MSGSWRAIRARAALDDARCALIDFEQSGNTGFRRSRWVALITLLRSVGLVLKRVDWQTADSLSQVRIDAAWQALKDSKPDPRIFHEFIDDERFSVVHRYDSSAAVIVTGYMTGHPFPPLPAPSDRVAPQFVMDKGPFKGRDPLELAREAIEFWERYLTAIES